MPSDDIEHEIADLLADRVWLHEDVKLSIPLERAQWLMYDAFESPDRDERIRLAKQALRITKDCADAYVVLAEEASDSPQEARRLYQDGVEAGERAYKDVGLGEVAGDFWGLLIVRPFLRALDGLAGINWFLDRRDEAIEQFERLLEIDTGDYGDYQEARYHLVACLLDADRDDDVAKLLDRFERDDSAQWAYSRALVTYRREGAGKPAEAAMRKALERNARVAAYMLGIDRISPELLLDANPPEDAREAVDYYAAHIAYWLRTPNAIEWFRRHADEEELRKLYRTRHWWQM